MKKLLLTLTLLLIAASTPALAEVAGTTLEISAEAQVKRAPDIATISAGVITAATTTAKAMDENSQKMNGLFKTLKEAGIAEKDIQTSGISVSPQYAYKENQAPRITGYQVSNTVSVILRDLKMIGPTLEALVAQGGNQLSGPDFSIENADAALDTARRDALTKARKRADIYAEAAGLKVKRILSISEQTTFAQPRPMMMMKSMAASADAMPVAAGEVNMSATVNVKFELGM